MPPSEATFCRSLLGSGASKRQRREWGRAGQGKPIPSKQAKPTKPRIPESVGLAIGRFQALELLTEPSQWSTCLPHPSQVLGEGRGSLGSPEAKVAREECRSSSPEPGRQPARPGLVDRGEAWEDTPLFSWHGPCLDLSLCPVTGSPLLSQVKRTAAQLRLGGDSQTQYNMSTK